VNIFTEIEDELIGYCFFNFFLEITGSNDDILLQKLKYYGTSRSALNLIQNYLSNRKQCVKLGTALSIFVRGKIFTKAYLRDQF
jgi:hypothetical protein